MLTLSTDTSLNGKLDAADPSLQIARVEFADKINKAAVLESSIRQTLFLSIVVEGGKRLNLPRFF